MDSRNAHRRPCWDCRYRHHRHLIVYAMPRRDADENALWSRQLVGELCGNRLNSAYTCGSSFSVAPSSLRPIACSTCVISAVSGMTSCILRRQKPGAKPNRRRRRDHGKSSGRSRESKHGANTLANLGAVWRITGGMDTTSFNQTTIENAQ